jgi:4-cresol dehydrogenase (hydroxylating) flavoprotein subunit
MLADALDAWRKIIGAAYVMTDEGTLAQVQTATFSTTQKVLAVIQPANRSEVQACVRIANTYKVPLYPVSRGKNWGYGSQVPVRDGSVILSLQRLDRIVEYDERLAYVTVEPGVTMRQVCEFLQEKRAALLVSITGGPMEGSLIGNVLERGLGIGRYADHFAHACAFEVILPTGDCIHTGFDRFPNAQSAHVNRWSVGPYIDGLFTQSNLGIVTQMTIWLMPAPRYFCSCLFALDDEARLGELIDALYTLNFEGGFAAPVHLYNDYKWLSMSMQPSPQVTSNQPWLTSAVMKSMRSVLGFSAWNGLITLRCASKQLRDAERAFIQEILSDKVASLTFIESEPIHQQSLASDGHDIGDLSAGRTNLLGGDRSIRTTYWKKKTIPSREMDPNRDGCGVIWCAPTVPFTGQHVNAAWEIINQVCLVHNFEPHVTLICLTERSVIITIALLYDREVPGEDERAMACHNNLLQQLLARGYIPYRLGIQSMQALPAVLDDYNALLCRVKNALDPNDILAPGRYDFRSDWRIDQH